MLTYVSAVLNLPQRQRGLTMVEYALGGALIVVAIILGITFIGTTANTTLSKIGSAVNK